MDSPRYHRSLARYRLVPLGRIVPEDDSRVDRKRPFVEKKDQLIGLKENVIIGRLIPAGTGVKHYRDVAIDVQRGPSWAEQSLTALVEAEDRDLSGDNLSSLAFPSLAEMAADEEGFEDA